MKKQLRTIGSFISRKLGITLLLGCVGLYQANAQVSVTATAGTTGPSPYTTVNAALGAITAGTHQGAITITITANTTEPAFNASNQLLASGVGLANYQSVKIVPVGNVTVSSPATLTGGRGLLEFIGADSITIDGDDPLTAGSRNLTFQLSSVTTTYTSALRFSSSSSTANGCRDVTVKNCIIIGARASATATNIGFGITANGSSNGTITSVTTGAADNDNMRIENNEFRRCYYGFHAYGTSTNVMDSLVVRNNKFGSDISAQNMGLFGIYLGNTALLANTGSVVVEGNDIQGGDYGTTGWSANIAAINLNSGNSGAIVRNNHIHDLNQPSTGGYGAFGVFISSGTSNNDIRIHNNIIRNIKVFTYQSSLTSTFQPIGIFAASSGILGLKINHNSILMPPQLVLNSTFSSHGVLLVSGVVLSEFNNNIIQNQYASSAGYAVTSNDIANISTSNMDRNNYYVAGANIGYVNGGARSTLAAWKTASSKDTNSFNVIPPFISATNLRLQTGAKSALESGGALTSVTSDIDGNVRPGPVGSINGGGTAPDVGAHEADLRLDILSADSVNATQVVQVVAPGDTSKAILNIKIYASGSIGTPFNLNSLILNTAGTTNASNIASAKVFYTGAGNSFSTDNLYGTTASPNGSFTVAGSQTISAGVHNFWLAYDISSGATSGNLADARLDSVSIGSIHLVPANGNPSGSVTILNPMTYIGSTVSQSNISSVYLNETNREVVGLRVIMSSTGSSVLMTSLNINLNGTTDTADIANIKVWYTGNNKNFATTNQFGTTTTNAPATASPFGFTLSGSQLLLNDTNYFWVTYDIKGSAVALNVIDGEITQFTIGSTVQIPTVTAPAGNRTIKIPHCPASATNSGDTDIGRVQLLDALNNSIFSNGSATPIINNPAATGMYNNHTLLTPASLLKGGTYSIRVDQITSGGTFYPAGLIVYVDWNDDGDFLDADEAIYSSGATQTGPQGGTPTTTFFVGGFSIPCHAALGNLRMRVMLQEGVSTTPSCGTFAWGEVEDYTINVLDNPLTFRSVGAEQQTGITSVGATDRVITRIPIRVDGCGTAVLTQVRMSTTGTTTPANIANAKLYRTTGNSFNTTDLRQTIASPSGQFIFTLTDTLLKTNDTVNYWLAYDVSATAATSNLLDAVLDSIEIMGSYKLPANGNPSGAVTIIVPMTYLGSSVIQPNLSSVYLNETTKEVIGLRVIMSSTGAPVNLTTLNVNLNGTTDTADIQNIKVWYTGTNSTFASTNQFGSTMTNAPATAAPFTFTVSGSQSLALDTNYFWVTFDIKATATPLNTVDAEITQLTVAGNIQIPAVTTAVGNRVIKTPHCPASANNTGDTDIGQIQLLDALSNVLYSNGANTPVLNNVAATGTYSNKTTGTAPANLLKGNTYTVRVDQITSGGTFYSAGVIVYIDWNDDGDFADLDEMAYSSGTNYTGPTGAAPTTTFLAGNITVPCHASLGTLRMRILLQEGVSTTLACGTFDWGEVEDHTINVLDNPLAFQSVGALQQTGIVAPGTNNVAITRIPVRANGCGSAVLTEVRMSTTGTTNVADIVSAKLYRTTGTTFNTADLRQTVSSPSGQFTFILTDTLPKLNDTVNYWLAYDINPGAAFGNFADARLDSILLIGAYRLPANGNPAGNVEINAPMTFVSATTTQSVVSKVEKGSVNNQIIGMQVVMSATGSAADLTQITINLNGTTDTSDIQNIKVWYTGSNNAFATTNQFDTTKAVPATSAPFTLTFTDIQSMNNGINYFWVTYDIKTTATTTNLVDAEFTGLTVSSISQVPTVTAPTGSREIMNPYCIPAMITGCGIDYVSQVTTVGAVNNINNLTACNGNLNGYIYYNNITPAARLGGTFTLQLMAGGDTEGLGVWIDFNNDGIFSATEFLYSAAPSIGVLQTATITIPTTASLGSTRMRVRAMYNYTPLDVDACLGANWGETEDYNFTILPAPPPTTYVWNRTVPSSFVVDSNWTPARSFKNMNDVLVFNGGSAVSVSNVESETISKLVVANNTRVTLATTSATADLTITDSLNLTSGTLVTGTNVTPIVGLSATNTGVVSGSGKVQGTLTRWIAAATGSYSFPMVNGNKNRAATINYTTAPTTGGKLNITHVSGAPGKGGLPVTDGSLLLDSISIDGVWRSLPSAGLSGGTFDITINADSIIGVNNFTTIALLGRANASSPWLAVGTHVTTTGSNTAMVLSRTGLISYGEIGIAGTAANPLPVTLTSFTGIARGIDGILNWATSTETNNQGFQVEKSLDGRTFERTGEFVKGAGNSRTVKNYSLTDANAFAKARVVYYRLKQLDLDGRFAYSPVVKVSASVNTVNGLSVFPNPYSDSYQVSFNAATDGDATIEMADIQGRVILSETSSVTAGNNSIPMNNVGTVNAGIYFVRVTKDGETTVIKLVKN